MTDVGSIASNFSTVSLCGGFVVGLLVHYGIKKTGDRNSVRARLKRDQC